MRLTILFFIFCFFISANPILAIGVGANVSSLDLELKLKQPRAIKISVFNISKEAGIFQVFPDELNDWIKINPNNFRLEAGENKEIEIAVLAKKKGDWRTDLSVLAKPLERQTFSVGSGLKLPLRLRVKEEKTYFLASVFESLNQTPPLLLAAILLIFLSSFGLIKSFIQKKSVARQS